MVPLLGLWVLGFWGLGFGVYQGFWGWGFRAGKVSVLKAKGAQGSGVRDEGF